MAVTSYQSISTIRSEFSLNGLKLADQNGADIVALRNGGFALSYATVAGSEKSFAVSLFDKDYAPISVAGQTFTVPYAGSSAGVGLIDIPQIVERQDGNVAVYWAKLGESYSDTSYYSVIDPTTGSVVNRQVLLSNMSTIVEMEAVVLANGLIGVVRASDGYPALDLMMRTATGSHIAIYSLEGSYEGNLIDIAATGLADGGLVVCYVDSDASNALQFEVRGADGGRTGSWGSLASGPASTIAGDIAVVGIADGGFAVAYPTAQSGIALFVVHGNPSGLPTVGPIQVDTNLAAVECDVRLTLLGTNILVTWSELDPSGNGTIMARLMDTSGQPVMWGDSDQAFVVADSVSDLTEPQVTVLASGDVMFTWTDSAGDGTNAGIRGKILRMTNVVEGDAEGNHLTGTDAFDLIRALDGDDTLDGGQGGDTLLGGAGNDVYFVDDRSDDVQELADEGQDHVYSAISWTMNAHTELLTLTGSDDLEGQGSLGADTISGNAGANRLIGNQNDDRLAGNAGADSLYGNEGNDILEGGDAEDHLDGGRGNDLLSGAMGHDTLYGGAGPGNDLLMGKEGTDLLFGQAGDDTLDGGASDDLLLGGLGCDRLTGGAGQDRFVFRNRTESAVGADRDVITDFRAGIDIIDLKPIDANLNRPGNNRFEFIGSDAFSAAGQLRFAAGILSGDVNGDGTADFEIALLGVTRLTGNWLIA